MAGVILTNGAFGISLKVDSRGYQ